VSAGIHWKNHQEDVQLSTSPIVSASGTNGPVNSFNGSTQFNYAVKHNPMAFFADTWLENVFPLSQFFQDLSTGALGRYNSGRRKISWRSAARRTKRERAARSGTITPGKRASLLLLRADPLASLAAFDAIETVFVDGRPFAREELRAAR
jgi:hypothetical protein